MALINRRQYLATMAAAPLLRAADSAGACACVEFPAQSITLVQMQG